MGNLERLTPRGLIGKSDRHKTEISSNINPNRNKRFKHEQTAPFEKVIGIHSKTMSTQPSMWYGYSKQLPTSQTIKPH